MVKRAAALPLAAGATALAAATYAYRYLAFESFSNDHFVHLAAAQQMTFGALPVRDFVEHGLPLTEALSTAAQLAAPGLLTEVWLVAVAFAAAALLTAIVATRVSGSVAIGIMAAAVTVVAHPVSYSYPKLLPYAATFLAAWWYGTRPGMLSIVVLAASVAVAFLFRHDHGVILGAAAAAALVALHGRTARRTIPVFAAAVVLLAAPYLVWVQAHWGVAEYVRDGIAFSRREADKATWTPPVFAIDRAKPLFARMADRRGPVVNVRWERMPEPTLLQRERAHRMHRLDPVGPRTWQYELSDWSPPGLERLVRDEMVLDTHGIDRSEFRLLVPAPGIVERTLSRVSMPADGLRPRQNGVAVLYYGVWLLPIAAAVALARGWQQLLPATRAVVVLAVVAQILMNRSMLRDPLDTRVRDVLAPAAVLIAFVTARLRTSSTRPIARIAAHAAAAGTLVLALSASAAAGSIGERLRTIDVAGGSRAIVERAGTVRRAFDPPRHRTGTIPEAYVPLVAYLGGCTPPGGRILTMTFAPELFFFTNRGFAAGLPSLTPGYLVTERHARAMMDRLAREDVPYVVMDTETAAEMRQHYARLSAHVERRYREVTRYEVSAGKAFVVLADVSRPVTRQVADRQLPCFTAGEAPAAP